MLWQAPCQQYFYAEKNEMQKELTVTELHRYLEPVSDLELIDPKVSAWLRVLCWTHRCKPTSHVGVTAEGSTAGALILSGTTDFKGRQCEQVWLKVIAFKIRKVVTDAGEGGGCDR